MLTAIVSFSAQRVDIDFLMRVAGSLSTLGDIMKRISCTILLVALGFMLCADDSVAQRYRYMDSSGNIHFVESLKEVPYQYRQQIVPATPTPVLDEKTLRRMQQKREQELRRQQRKLEAEAKKKEKAKKVAEERAAKQAAAGGTRHRADAPPPSSQDEIEVIR